MGSAVRLPTLPVGCSSEHADFPGTLSLRAETLTAIVRDTLASLTRHGFDTIFLFSAHGGNFAALREALPQLDAAARPARLISYTDLDRLVAVWHRACGDAGVGDRCSVIDRRGTDHVEIGRFEQLERGLLQRSLRQDDPQHGWRG